MMNKQPALVIVLALLCSIVVGACSSTPKQEDPAEFLDNSLITARVKSRLIDDRVTGNFHISVYTFKGVVRLTGTVNTEQERLRAAEIAATVPGVTKVDNKLQIRTE